VLPAVLCLHRAVPARHLEKAANVDSKTGLLTAAAWHTRAQRALLHRKDRAGGLCAVLVLDRFKAVNDAYGHLAGDHVLAAVAAVLRAEVRDRDLVGRFGGEEFVVLVDGGPGNGADLRVEDVSAVAERIRRRVAGLRVAVPAPGGSRTIEGLSVSIGGALHPAHGSDLPPCCRSPTPRSTTPSGPAATPSAWARTDHRSTAPATVLTHCARLGHRWSPRVTGRGDRYAPSQMAVEPWKPRVRDAAMTEDTPPGIEISIPSSPRIWNYWLGGKDNYAVDREAGDAFVAMYPPIVDIARASRGFHVRAVTYLAGDAGIRQFLDIGTGLPTFNNTHEVAQSVAPDSRIVYVDNDPVVLAYARSLLVGTPQGATAYIDADLRDPDAILRIARETLDFDQPVGLMLMNILGHIDTHPLAREIVQQLVAALPAGSYLVVADGTDVVDPVAFTNAIDYWNSVGSLAYHLRGPEEIAAYFEGLTLLEPGVVSCPRWRPTGGIGQVLDVDEFGGVGRKDT
jgi:diguanylate cyclase (GGDEF)-like protein